MQRAGLSQISSREIAERLGARRHEIEEALLARVYDVSDPAEVEDPDYVVALRGAVGSALDYALAAIEPGATPSPPRELLAQARLAAWSRVSLDTVLRRYFAGYALLGNFILQEAVEGKRLDPAELQALIGRLSGLLDELVCVVGEEYSRIANGSSSSEELRARRVRRLLAGEVSHAGGLGYDLDLTHLGAIVSGTEIGEAVLKIARSLDCRLLEVSYGGASWIWFGSRRALEPIRLAELFRELSGEIKLAIGEPARGLSGWQLTHRQARAAMPIVLSGDEDVVCYRDVALLAAVLRDDVLATSLQRLYLAPLAKERDGGEILRKTLRAYLSAQRNVSSAAAVLGVNRNTVANRLREVERRVGRNLNECVAEIDAALRMESLHRARC